MLSFLDSHASYGVGRVDGAFGSSPPVPLHPGFFSSYSASSHSDGVLDGDHDTGITGIQAYILDSGLVE